ncbi:hypothetical protein PHMEG_00034075 [Phytophthora megakarya]|uniref:Bzip transcription factor n=1 Tax=Phytophthora megakarya TaxID=4795 RepID=A0A225URV7_9STRA|nr:hypothetical protein PHMEG_00034075 [Phytophthora megakarya]
MTGSLELGTQLRRLQPTKQLCRATLRQSRSEAMQREIHRKSQARYRQKQRQKLQNLEGGVQRLRGDIDDLTNLLVSVSLAIQEERNIWTTVLEYFRFFGRGFTEEPSGQALSFLQKCMTPDVSDGYLRGPRALLQNWMLLSSYFDDIHVELESMEKRTQDTLLVTICTSISISRNTLQLVFPHLNSDGHGGVNGGIWSPLAKRLEGQRLIVKGSVRFDWDCLNRRVFRMLSYSDMLTAMLQEIDKLDDVSYIFEGALVTPDWKLVIQREYRL